MKKTIIKANECMNADATMYYSLNYMRAWSPETGFVNMLKNDKKLIPASKLEASLEQLLEVLQNDLPVIAVDNPLKQLTVCLIPRAKVESHYTEQQQLFRKGINDAVNALGYFDNGVDFIKRQKSTRTTHLWATPDKDPKPYLGITKQTCYISANVKGRDIILIDDVYTRNANIDEDAIQALLDAGAKSVMLYAICYTKPKLHYAPIKELRNKVA